VPQSLAPVDVATGSLSSAVRSIPPIGAPVPVSSRPGVTSIKKLILRATNWLVEPQRVQLNELRDATVRALDATQAALVSSQSLNSEQNVRPSK